jgi:hypothetical protein
MSPDVKKFTGKSLVNVFMRSVPDAASNGTADEDAQDIEPGIEQEDPEVLEESRKDVFFFSNR